MLTERMIDEISEISYTQRLPAIDEIIEDEGIKISQGTTDLEYELFVQKLYALILNKKLIEAVELSNQLIAIGVRFNTRFDVFRHKATALYKLKRYKESLAVYEEIFSFVTELHCSWYEFYFNAADAAEQEGLIKKSFNYYKECIFSFLEDACDRYQYRDSDYIEWLHEEFDKTWNGLTSVVSKYTQATKGDTPEKKALLKAKIQTFQDQFKSASNNLIDLEFFTEKDVFEKSNELHIILKGLLNHN